MQRTLLHEAGAFLDAHERVAARDDLGGLLIGHTEDQRLDDAVPGQAAQVGEFRNAYAGRLAEGEGEGDAGACACAFCICYAPLRLCHIFDHRVRWPDRSLLGVVVATLNNLKLLFRDAVNETMLVRYSARPQAPQITLQTFRLADSDERATASVLNEFVNPIEHGAILCVPNKVVVPRARAKKYASRHQPVEVLLRLRRLPTFGGCSGRAGLTFPYGNSGFQTFTRLLTFAFTISIAQ